VVLYGAFHLNQIGLPSFAKDFLVGQLRERGLDLEFSRMRIRLGRGIVAENVNVGRAEGGMEDQLFVDQIQLKLDWWTVLRFRPEIRAVTLRGGKVALPIGVTNAPAARFEVEDIEGLLVFAAPEHWVLEHLRGRCLGGAFDASGSFTNAGALRRRKEGPSEPPGPWRRVLLRTVQEAFAAIVSAMRPVSVSGAVSSMACSAFTSTSRSLATLASASRRIDSPAAISPSRTMCAVTRSSFAVANSSRVAS
jgi:hypothetical protein